MSRYLTIILIMMALLSGCKATEGNLEDLNNVDRGFVINASMMNKTEMDLGQLAATGATNTGVQAFGQVMVSDHAAMRTQLRAIAAGLLLPAPDSMDANHLYLKNQLMGLTGRNFDSVFINSQVPDHQIAISIFQNEINNGASADLKSFASQHITKLQDHLRVADSLARHL
jgi:putative membrane protein